MHVWLLQQTEILFDADASFGLVEVKCTFLKRNITPVEACVDPSFFCEYEDGHNCKIQNDHTLHRSKDSYEFVVHYFVTSLRTQIRALAFRELPLINNIGET
jgi:hypothetical protein